MSLPLEGKVAMVTGGGQGLGEGIVKRLAEAGCDVAVVDIILENAEKVAADVKAMGRRAVAIQTDVTQWDQIQSMVDQTVEKLGKLDIAVNNAGVISIKSVAELTEEDWDFVNLDSLSRLPKNSREPGLPSTRYALELSARKCGTGRMGWRRSGRTPGKPWRSRGNATRKS